MSLFSHYVNAQPQQVLFCNFNCAAFAVSSIWNENKVVLAEKVCIFDEPDCSVLAAVFLISYKKKLDCAGRSNSIFQIIKGSKSSRTKPLLIIFYTAPVNLSVFFYNSPWVCIPEFWVAYRNYVHMSHYPYTLRIICTRNCYNKARSYTGTNTAVWSFKALNCTAVFVKAVIAEPAFEGSCLFRFSISTALRGNGRNRGE